MIIENEEDLYFINLINNMKWNMKFTQFELLIKWEKYEQQTWELYTIIKKNVFELMKEFHKDHSSWFVSVEWVKNENKWLLSNTWSTRSVIVQEQQKNTAWSTWNLVVQEQQKNTAQIIIWNTQTQRIWLYYIIW